MDTYSPERRSEIMRSIRSKDTKPEIVIRRLLHRMGYRFRLHSDGLPGKPDVVLPKYKTVVLVHGCFWHGCVMCDRGTRVPKTNTAFWLDKIAANRRRDQEVLQQLQTLGWTAIQVWACQTNDLTYLTDLFTARLPREGGGNQSGPSSTSFPAAAG